MRWREGRDRDQIVRQKASTQAWPAAQSLAREHCGVTSWSVWQYDSVVCRYEIGAQLR
jgi:hypothetical protein